MRDLDKLVLKIVINIMVADFKQYPPMSPEEYLIWEAKQELRHEYIDGEIRAMTGGTFSHARIYLNLYRQLYPHLEPRGCEAAVSDVKVKPKTQNRYFYPDLVVTCNADDLKSRNFIQNPIVIAEVLSPSTESYDRTKKLQYYRQIPSLQEYVLIAAEEIAVEVFRRGEGKMWLYYQYEAGETIRLDSIDFECAIDLLYERVIFEENSEEHSP